MPISDDLRSRIRATQENLSAEQRPSGTRAIITYLRFERPLTLSGQDEDAIWDAGWAKVVGDCTRGQKTEGGARTVFSVPDEAGRSYKQLQIVTLPDALGILQMYESNAHAYRIQARGWWSITQKLREMPQGATVADIFPTEERWDTYWQAIRDSDLWEQAA